ncbi:hypothetical protein COV49_00960 [Candidatus Falkowbacteria bacterium CG11_big_fil_rev_8_21_14_0_20_39_10]|uniref:Pilus assembly protein PilO n=1 Tax=Candidatus Falkowbacteria bacterium CG11_big_fil_rev_8_21_14_0_20_39_10 TaxID=1974570 RepID=A0A2M6K9S0_9BACT|nr:MAG: hypothetical protein COV49_00960 [Candidatus Falkowbacteria bacterium CG11_big_fil_rev_8_21_14_0_20_39_10]
MPDSFKSQKVKQKIQIFLGKYFRLVVFLAVIFIFFGGWFFLKPKYQQIISLTENQSRKVRSDFEGRKIYLDKLVSTINVYNQINPQDIKKVNAILPPPNIKETLFTYMDNLMSKNGFLLTSLSVQPVVAESASTKKRSSSSKEEKQTQATALPSEIGLIKMEMSIAGVDYNGVKRFLKTIENNLRLMDINQLGFDLGNETASISITTYYYKENLVPKKEAQPDGEESGPTENLTEE